MELARDKTDRYQECRSYKGRPVYDEHVLEFAERWAEAMQIAIYSGQQMHDVALPLAIEKSRPFNLAVTELPLAVTFLEEVWVHGDRLANALAGRP